MNKLLCLLPLLLLAACAGSNTRPDAPKSSEAAVPVAIDVLESATPTLPRGSVLRLELLDPVSSRSAKIGDRFYLRTVTEVTYQGDVRLPSGLRAYGEVIHADKRGLAGKPGELLVKLRSLEWQGQEIKLRNATNAAGKNRTTAALVTSQVFGLFGIFVTGGEAEIARGSVILAELVEDLPLPSPAP